MPNILEAVLAWGASYLIVGSVTVFSYLISLVKERAPEDLIEDVNRRPLLYYTDLLGILGDPAFLRDFGIMVLDWGRVEVAHLADVWRFDGVKAFFSGLGSTVAFLVLGLFFVLIF